MSCSKRRYSAACLILAHVAAGCASVPLDRPKSMSHSNADNSGTAYGQLMSGWQALHDGKSGFFPFVLGRDALGARLEIAEKAEQSIDLQYFLMKDDEAGAVMSKALWRAAERGVRIRFLLDDVFTTAPDRSLLALNEHPRIEIRLFNPVSRRGLHALNFVGHFRRANRRMHNKSFTADNAISIVGGRNIADEYFQLEADAAFSDFDILAFGPVVQEVSASFDTYWNHSLAIPINQLTMHAHDRQGSTPKSRHTSDASEQEQEQKIYDQAVGKGLIHRLATGEEELFVARGRVIADDPEKLQNAVGTDQMRLATELGSILSEAQRELIFISPYYVPGNDGVEFLERLIAKGVRAVVVTNSLASTNHIPVHSAYSGYRKKALRAGIELYEVRANAGGAIATEGTPSHLTLHTKLIVIDRRYLFVGSPNLDPRSLEINAEMGLMIDSRELSELVAAGLFSDLPNVAYRVALSERGTLEWHSDRDKHPSTIKSEPLSTRWRRFKAWVLRIVPDGQL